MKFGALILGLLLSWQFAEAKTILVSDIDDTVKNTHVLDFSESARNALSTENLIVGMNDAYQLLKRQYEQTHQEIDIYYVSNAPPWWIGETHRKFMAEHEFPVAGDSSFYFRRNLNDKTHKVTSIKSILTKSIDQERQDINSIIFVGDNGEADILVYQEASSYIRQKYPNIKVSTYIRMGYWTKSSEDTGRATVEDQVGYATALDLVLNWNAVGILDGSFVADPKYKKQTNPNEKPEIEEHDPSRSLANFISNFSTVLEGEPSNQESGVLIFPKWVDCRDVFFGGDLLTSVPPDTIELASKALQKVTERCSVPGTESVNKIGNLNF